MLHTLMRHIFSFFPVHRRKIVFLNFNGRGYGDNPKYIAAELVRRNLPYDLVWLSHTRDTSMPDCIRHVPYGSLRALYELATAHIIVNNVKNGVDVIKKPEQYFIQTWHAGFSFKRLEGDPKAHISPAYLEASQRDSALTDIFLSNSVRQNEEYRENFWCRCEILECGLPRNDDYFCDRAAKKQAVRHALHIPEGTRIALYAPTFRDDGTTDAYRLKVLSLLAVLKQKFGAEWILLLRLHPNVANLGSIYTLQDAALDVTKYADAQGLILASDAIITDYSTVLNDGVLCGIPSFIYATDVEKYEKLRGLKPEFYHLPIRVCENQTALEEEILHFDAEAYREATSIFQEKYATFDKGRASAAVADRIQQVIEGPITS